MSFSHQLQQITPSLRLSFVVQNLVERTKQSGKCQGCWLMKENCVCQRWRAVNSQTKIVVQIHHSEWQVKRSDGTGHSIVTNRGISSNTAICIHRTLIDSLFLLRGLPEDDEKMKEVWEDQQYTPCILWPGDEAITVPELKASLPADSKLLLVVPDGTFSGARRMMKKYPKHCIRVSLSSESVLGDKSNSFLYPVRKYGGSESETGRVSTLEAVAAFLRELGEDPSVSESLIDNMKVQMDMALKQKCRPMIYQTTEEGFLSKE